MTTSATDVLEQVREFITANDLPAPTIDIRQASSTGKNYNPDTGDFDLPDQPTVTVGGFLHAADFTGWFTAVGVATVRIGRRKLDTTVNAGARYDGITWQVWGSLPRPESWARMPVQPRWGADGETRDKARVSVGEFALIAAALPDR